MAEHPSFEQLEDFVLCRLDAVGAVPVVAHLIKGCAACRAILDQVRTSPPPMEAYDEALDRVLSAFRWNGTEALEGRARSRKALKGIAACEVLLEQSWSLRHEDPGKMLELANHARLLADRLNPEYHGPRRVADLRCRAWSALGNAYRVTDDLDSAEQALSQAAELQLQGTGDELLAVRLLDFQASLYGAQRRFPAALAALTGVYAIHNRRGDDHLAGRALISKGIYTGHANKPGKAVRLLKEGLARIDQEREPQLALSAVHNIASFLVDCGHLRQARNLTFTNRWRYERYGRSIDRVKLRWLQGLIDSGLNNLTVAEEALKEARQGFRDAGLGYHSALAGLDLGSILLRQQRSEEARAMVLESSEVFLKLRIEREALAAIMMLKQAFEAGIAACALLDDAIQFLRRIQHDPALTFSDWFL